MTADMIIKFFENYGLIMTLLATGGIAFVGALKSIGVFSKLNPKAKKYVYFACSCLAGIISCTVYLCVKDAFVWADWGMTAASVIGFTISIYGLYENTGIRTLLKKILFTPIKNLLKSIPSVLMSKSMTEEKLLQLAKNLGSDILLQLANETRQKEADGSESECVVSDIEDSIGFQTAATETGVDKSESENDGELIKNNFFS